MILHQKNSKRYFGDKFSTLLCSEVQTADSKILLVELKILVTNQNSELIYTLRALSIANANERHVYFKLSRAV